MALYELHIFMYEPVRLFANETKINNRNVSQDDVIWFYGFIHPRALSIQGAAKRGTK